VNREETNCPHSTVHGPRSTVHGLGGSYAYCRQLAKKEAGNFYHAFRLLPTEQHRAMCALYAFMRLTDDLTDAAGPLDEKRENLARWRLDLIRALDGEPTHPLHPAFCHTLRHFHIPQKYVEDVLDGVAMDLERTRYQTFEELYPYCYRVASAVGLCCIHIWGFSDERALVHAEAAGVALQLTNILRDVAEDAQRGRIYLPLDELKRYGYSEENLLRGVADDSFRALMEFQAERARGFYESAGGLIGMLPPPGRAVFLVMSQTYRELLSIMAARHFDVFRHRARVSPWRKLWFAVRALPVRLGWARTSGNLFSWARD
jgi:phytoene synthase